MSVFKPAFRSANNPVISSALDEEVEDFRHLELHALTPVAQVMQEIKTGTGPLSSPHAGVLYHEDHEGNPVSFAANEPVWKWARVSGGVVYTTDTNGDPLDPQPMLARTAFSDSGLTTPVDVPNTLPAANHSDTKGPILLEIDLLDDSDTDVLKVGSDVVLQVEDGGVGDELVVNGTFDTDSDWNKAVEWTISDGKARCDGTSVGNTTIVQYSVGGSTVIGDAYIVEFDLEVIATAINYVSFGGATDGTDLSVSGHYKLLFVAESTAAVLTIAGSVGFEGTLDNVSVKRAAKVLTLSDQTNEVSMPLLGEELVENGTFDTDSDWTESASTLQTIANGELKIQNVGAVYGQTYQVINFIVGKTYRFTGELKDLTASSCVCRVMNTLVGGGTTLVSSPLLTAAGKIDFVWTATQAGCSLVIAMSNTEDGRAILDNVSVKPLTAAGEHKAGIAFDADALEMQLNVDGVWSEVSDYDGSLGSGDIELGTDTRKLKRGSSAYLDPQKTIIDEAMG